MPELSLKKEADLCQKWLCEKALPFWAENGIDDQGGWYEHLALNGQPNIDAIRRLRVQARQIYVYALAEKMGWYPGKNIASKTMKFMTKYGFERGETPGFLHLLTADYKVQDPRRDLYDHAFYLLACGWEYHVTGDESALELAGKIEAFLESLKSSYGGWDEGIPHTLPRRQNPHMHMFEAVMAWHDITGDPKWLAHAGDIFKLFEAHFFDAKHKIIREFFKENWDVADGDIGKTAEPGHLAEWIWLLWMYESRTGVDTSGYAGVLYGQITKKSQLFLNDEEDVMGAPRRSTKRLWVQTEVIKAHISQANRGVPGAASNAAKVMQAYRKAYLNDNGSWNDQLDENGNLIAETIPVSTFYHIICMIYEAVTCEA